LGSGLIVTDVEDTASGLRNDLDEARRRRLNVVT
jgi:hypothetical protein